MDRRNIEENARRFAMLYDIARETYEEFPSRGKRTWLFVNAPKAALCRMITAIGIERLADIAITAAVIMLLGGWLLYFCDRAYSFEYQNESLQRKLEEMTARADSLSTANDSLNAAAHTEMIRYWVWEGFSNRNAYQKPTSDIVKRIATECGSNHPNVVAKVVRLESANGTTSVAKRTNNVTGMGKSMARKSTRSKKNDSKEAYSEYEHWIHSVVDFVLWESMFDTAAMSDDEYCDFLQEKYNRNQTRDYSERLKSIKIG